MQQTMTTTTQRTWSCHLNKRLQLQFPKYGYYIFLQALNDLASGRKTSQYLDLQKQKPNNIGEKILNFF